MLVNKDFQNGNLIGWQHSQSEAILKIIVN